MNTIALIKKFVGLIENGFILLKIGGPGIFLKQLKRQIYSRSNQIGLALNLEELEITKKRAKVKYTLKLATEKDIDKIWEKAKFESKEMVQPLLFRRWMFKHGYHNCYIAKTAETNEICAMAFLIFPEDIKRSESGYRSWFPRLKEDEAIIAGTYTFEKFRGNYLHPSIVNDLSRICKERGYKWVLAYVEQNNIDSLKGFERTGFKRSGNAPELKLLFFTSRDFSHIQRVRNEGGTRMAISNPEQQRE
jgi:hypothetical protein